MNNNNNNNHAVNLDPHSSEQDRTSSVFPDQDRAPATQPNNAPRQQEFEQAEAAEQEQDGLDSSLWSPRSPFDWVPQKYKRLPAAVDQARALSGVANIDPDTSPSTVLGPTQSISVRSTSNRRDTGRAMREIDHVSDEMNSQALQRGDVPSAYPSNTAPNDWMPPTRSCCASIIQYVPAGNNDTTDEEQDGHCLKQNTTTGNKKIVPSFQDFSFRNLSRYDQLIVDKYRRLLLDVPGVQTESRGRGRGRGGRYRQVSDNEWERTVKQMMDRDPEVTAPIYAYVLLLPSSTITTCSLIKNRTDRTVEPSSDNDDDEEDVAGGEDEDDSDGEDHNDYFDDWMYKRHHGWSVEEVVRQEQKFIDTYLYTDKDGNRLPDRDRINAFNNTTFHDTHGRVLTFTYDSRGCLNKQTNSRFSLYSLIRLQQRSPCHIPGDIAIFNKLRRLRLYYVDSLPPTMKYLTKIEELIVTAVLPIHIPPGTLSGMTNLKTLKLYFTPLTADALMNFKELPNVKNLRIALSVARARRTRLECADFISTFRHRLRRCNFSDTVESFHFNLDPNSRPYISEEQIVEIVVIAAQTLRNLRRINLLFSPCLTTMTWSFGERLKNEVLASWFTVEDEPWRKITSLRTLPLPMWTFAFRKVSRFQAFVPTRPATRYRQPILRCLPGRIRICPRGRIDDDEEDPTEWHATQIYMLLRYDLMNNNEWRFRNKL